MSLDLKNGCFIFGNLDIVKIRLNTLNFHKILKDISLVDPEFLKKDKSLPWRFMNNFKILLNFYENYLISGGEEFKNLYNFLYDFIKILENIYKNDTVDLNNPKKESDFFNINKIIVINLFKEKIILYENNNFEGISDIVKNFNKKFHSYLEENGQFLYEYNVPYEDSRWTSKWKLITKNKEITFENIDIYLDNYFKNSNFYYNSSMFNNIRELSERLVFLQKNIPEYLGILNKKLEEVTEKIFNTFPYNIIYSDYRKLLKFECYRPGLLVSSKEITEEILILSILPEFFSFYLLGFPVVSLDVPDTKQLVKFSEKLKICGEEKYFKWISEIFNSNYISSITMGLNSGNGIENNKIVDLCYNEICDFNQDDISCLFSDTVYHCFSSPEFEDILKKQENPYNRQLYPNINKILENIKFKNKLRKNLLSRGLDLELNGTMVENWKELKSKIKIRDNMSYYPYVDTNPSNLYRPLLEMLFQSL